jgi:hypothetical protein
MLNTMSTSVSCAQDLHETSPSPSFVRRPATLGLRSEVSGAPPIVPVIVLYVAVLTAAAGAINALDPLHHDMTEAWAWGQALQWGYAKHPPVMAWVAGLWFKLLPRSDLNFYLLAALNAAIGLCGVWRAAGYVLPRSQQMVPVLLLLLTPAFTLHAIRYNANAALLAIWPWAIVALMRALQVGTATSGLWLGGLLALAMLTKYYSAVLVVVAAITVMLHPDRHRFIRSPAVPAAVAAGVFALVPHLFWAVNAEFPSVNYAAAKIRSDTVPALLASLISSVLGVLSLGVAAAGLLLLYGRHAGTFARARLWANLRCRNTAWIVWLGVGPLLVSLASAAVFSIPLTTHFLIPAFCMVPIAVLVIIDKSVTPRCEYRLAMGVVAVWALVIVGHASETVYRLRGGGAPPELRREMASASERLFQLATGRPLRFVGGDLALATAIGFYGTEGAAYWESMAARATTAAAATNAAEAGLLLACGAADINCLRQLAPHARGDHRLFELSVERKDRAGPGGVTKTIILIVPPVGVPITSAARN